MCPSLLVNIRSSNFLNDPSALLPLALPTHQQLKGYRVADGGCGTLALPLHWHPSHWFLTPSILLVQHFESHSYRETNRITLCVFVVTWGPCKPSLHMLSSSSLLLLTHLSLLFEIIS